MTTSSEEYLNKLVQIQLGIDGRNYFPIPEIERIYKIDLNTRKVEAPLHLSVTDDHESEIIFFEVDRFFEKKDLSYTTCVILYENAAREHFMYPVPCMDVVSKAAENKIIMPWVISSDVTWGAGNVKFAFMFYEINPGTLKFEYLLQTLEAQTKVLQGMKFNYVDATEQAAQDYKDGKWAVACKNYFVKIHNSFGSYRYVHATPIYNAEETYYKREEEMRISDGTKLEAIYAALDEFKKGGLKWVEI